MTRTSATSVNSARHLLYVVVDHLKMGGQLQLKTGGQLRLQMGGQLQIKSATSAHLTAIIRAIITQAWPTL
jgi:hypothetical protein